jgi:hypothetical protein
MLAVLFAMVLLGSTILGVNVMLIDKTETMLEAEASLTAVSLGQSMMDEIMTKSYDAITAAGTRVWDSTLFTAPGALGPSGAETGLVPLPDPSGLSDKWYNDVDDYNGYIRRASTPILGNFTVRDSVYYVSESNLNVKVNHQTSLKRIVVVVTHRNMRYSLYLYDLYIYRKFF